MQEVARQFNDRMEISPPHGLEGWKARYLMPVTFEVFSSAYGSLPALLKLTAVLLSEDLSTFARWSSGQPACDVLLCGVPVDHRVETKVLAQTLRDRVLTQAPMEHMQAPANPEVMQAPAQPEVLQAPARLEVTQALARLEVLQAPERLEVLQAPARPEVMQPPANPEFMQALAHPENVHTPESPASAAEDDMRQTQDVMRAYPKCRKRYRTEVDEEVLQAMPAFHSDDEGASLLR